MLDAVNQRRSEREEDMLNRLRSFSQSPRRRS